VSRPLALGLAALAVAAAWTVTLWAALDWSFAFPLDDSYIHLQYARELAHGHPFHYDAHDPATTGATSTLWPLLLAPGFWLGSNAAVAYAAVLAAILFACTVAAVYVAAEPLAGRRLATLSALAVALNGWFLATALSGMESPLIALGIALVLAALVHRRWRAALAALTVVALTRPEGAIAASVVGAVLAVVALRRGSRGRAALSLLPVAAAVAQAVAWTVVSGRPTTDTAVHKGVLYDAGLAPALRFASWLRAIPDAAAQFVTAVTPDLGEASGAYLVVPFLGVGLAVGGAILLRRERPFVVLTAAAVVASYVSIASTADWQNHHFRYLTAVLPVFVVLGAAALGAIDRAEPGPLAPWLATTIVVVSALAVPSWHGVTVREAADVDAQQVWLGRWIDAHLPASSRVAFDDAGAIKFYGNRPHFDLLGLVTANEAVTSRAGIGAAYERLAGLPARSRPDYVVSLGPLARPLRNAVVVGEAVAQANAHYGRPAGVVNRLHWSRAASASRPPRPWRNASWTLNVGNLDAERAGGYSVVAADPLRPPLVDLWTDGDAGGGPTVSEGCRSVAGESFRVPAGGLLVARFHTASSVDVSVDGEPVGTLETKGNDFAAGAVRLPHGGGVHLAARSGTYESCRYWVTESTTAAVTAQAATATSS